MKEKDVFMRRHRKSLRQGVQTEKPSSDVSRRRHLELLGLFKEDTGKPKVLISEQGMVYSGPFIRLASSV